MIVCYSHVAMVLGVSFECMVWEKFPGGRLLMRGSYSYPMLLQTIDLFAATTFYISIRNPLIEGSC